MLDRLARRQAVQDMPLDANTSREEKYQEEHIRCHKNEGEDGRETDVSVVPERTRISIKLIIVAFLARTIIIDTGKNFQAAALEWFPKYELRRIDAVLITHAHADGEPTSSRIKLVNNGQLSYERLG